MEESLKSIYMAFAVITFVTAITLLVAMQMAYDTTYKKVLEVINGGFIW